MKKAYLVTFAPCTRVVVDESATEDQITEAAYNNIQGNILEYLSLENILAIDEDKTMPYDPETDKNVRDPAQPVQFSPADTWEKK